MTDFTAFPIANVTIPSLPDLGGITDATMLVGERAGTGRFAATGLRDYVMTTVGAGYVPLTGTTMTGPLTLSGAPTAANHAATKTYTDAGDAAVTALANAAVKRSGDVMTGNLAMQDTLFFTSTGMSLNAGPSFSIWTLDSTNYEIIYNRSTGLLQYRRGTDGVQLWSVEATAGNMQTLGGYTAGGQGIIYGGVPSNGHWHAFGWTPDARLIVFVDGINEGAVAMASSVVELEARIDELRARIAGLERDRAELQETLTARIAALEARAGTGTTD